MSPKLTIAYESVDASPAPAANPGDRIDAMFEAAEERHRAARRVVSMLLRALVYLGALLTTAVLLFRHHSHPLSIIMPDDISCNIIIAEKTPRRKGERKKEPHPAGCSPFMERPVYLSSLS